MKILFHQTLYWSKVELICLMDSRNRWSQSFCNDRQHPIHATRNLDSFTRHPWPTIFKQVNAIIRAMQTVFAFNYNAHETKVSKGEASIMCVVYRKFEAWDKRGQSIVSLNLEIFSILSDGIELIDQWCQRI